MAARRRRRGGAPGIVVISWRDIPAQVTVELSGLRGADEVRWRGSDGRPGLAERIGSGVFLNGAASPSPARVRGPVTIEDRTYDGTLMMMPCPEGGLEARVQLGLEAYVEGVVASETSIWSATSAELEAQAIAARTGALVDEIDFPTFVASLVHGTFDAMVDASIRQMEAFADDCAGGAPFPATPDEILHATTVLEAVIKSAETGDRIPIS